MPSLLCTGKFLGAKLPSRTLPRASLASQLNGVIKPSDTEVYLEEDENVVTVIRQNQPAQ